MTPSWSLEVNLVTGRSDLILVYVIYFEGPGGVWLEPTQLL